MIVFRQLTLFLSTALLALSSPVYLMRRDATSVLDDLTALGKDTNSLTSAVSSYEGGLLGALPVTIAEFALSTQILKTTHDVEESDSFTSDESTEIALALAGLEPNITGALTELITKEPLFKASFLSLIVLADLKSLKYETDSLVSALEGKVTSTFAGLIATGSATIDAAYESAIAAYE